MKKQKRSIKTKLLMNVLVMGLVFFQPMSLVFAGLQAPSAPEAPSAPTAPETPESSISAPQAPDSPERPQRGSRDSKEEESQDDYEDEKEEEETEPDKNDSVLPGNLEPEEFSGEGTATPLLGETQDNGVGDVEIETGDANNDSTLTNFGNDNFAVAPGSAGSDVAIINDGNGSASQNGASIEVGSTDVLIQDNVADVRNDVEQDSNTGDNSASRNVGSASIETGDANVSSTIINALNTNAAGVMVSEFNVVDDQMGDLVLDFSAGCVAGCGGGDLFAKNADNGSGSTNDINATLYDSILTFQSNDADLENEVVLGANSGSNVADNNTGGDTSIQTGDANVAANIFNFANTNVAGNLYFGVVNLYGDLIGDIILPEVYFTGCDCGADATLSNLGNGSGSANNIAFTSVDADSIFQFNEALINNELTMTAETGSNEASDNTGGDIEIQTGDTLVNANILNVANTNLIGGDWWLVLINKAGQWVGQILGAPAGALMAGSEGTLFGTSSSGEVTAVNTGNGTDSSNTIGVTETSESTLVQENKGVINNKLNLTATTGNNSASRNTGGAVDIATGDATITANIVNFINNNIAGMGRIYVTVVNVFGNWVGDFVTPGNEKDKNLADNTPVGGLAEESLLSQVASDSEGDEDDNNDTESDKDQQDNDASRLGSASVVSPGGFVPTSVLTETNTKATVAGVVSQVIDEVAGEVSGATQSPTDLKTEDETHKIDINLAWLLVLVPLYGFYRFRRYLPL